MSKKQAFDVNYSHNAYSIAQNRTSVRHEDKVKRNRIIGEKFKCFDLKELYSENNNYFCAEIVSKRIPVFLIELQNDRHPEEIGITHKQRKIITILKPIVTI